MLLADPDMLRTLTSTADAAFEHAFDRLSHPEKESMRFFLIYVDKVLQFMTDRPVNGIRCTQLHFPEMADTLKHTLLEFVVISQFYRSAEKDMERNDYVPNRITLLNNKLIYNQAPFDASAIKGGNLAYRKWVAEKKSLRSELTFLRPFENSRKSFWPDTILNILNGDLPFLQESLYAVSVGDLEEQKRSAYCLWSVDLPIDRLISKFPSQDRLKSIRQVILFDCESRRNFQSYNKGSLERFIDRGYAMKDLVIFSFDKRSFRLSGLIHKLETTYKVFFLPPSQKFAFTDTYVLQEQEVDLLATGSDQSIYIRWIGEKSQMFVDYSDLVANYGINKLRSLSTLNLYAGALNLNIANLILADLFSSDQSSGLFDGDTRKELDQLDLNEIIEVKAAVRCLLEMIIQEWECMKTEMRELSKKGTVGIVVPRPLAANSIFRRELKTLLPDKKINIFTWKDIRDGNSKDSALFVLAYRDTGSYPFKFYPSILEKGPNWTSEFKPLFLTMLFGERFRRCNYYYHTMLCRLLKNDFRDTFLDWKRVEAHIKDCKPPTPKETTGEEEDDDELADTAESIKVTYIDNSHITLYASRPLITRKGTTGRLEVLRADELPENSDLLAVQPLDTLYEDLNLFQITEEQERELQEIKRQHGVSEPAYALWKVLLAKKLTHNSDPVLLYDQIGKVLGEGDFVQFEHFKNHWLDPKSRLLIPRKRKHFRMICDHLELPRAYYRLKLKKRSSLMTNNRQSNGRMTSLLSDMINEGLFEDGVQWDRISLQHYLELHELEEKGITHDNIREELHALADLLRDKIELRTIKNIERP